MGAIEAKVYKGNIALAAKRGVFVYFYFTTFTLFSFLHLLPIIPPSFGISPFFLSFLSTHAHTHAISPGFLFPRAEYPSLIMPRLLVERNHIFVDVYELERQRSAGFWAYSLTILKGTYLFLLLSLSWCIWVSGYGHGILSHGQTFGTIYNHFFFFISIF